MDIDAGSKYHNKNSLDKLRQLLATAGIKRTVIYRSSHSDGWHLYIFFDEPVSSKDLRNQLVHFLKLHDFDVKKGALEVFPHPGEGSNGQGLRLPLQPGFAWLDQKSFEVEYEREELSATKALEWFVDAMEGLANTRHDFHQLRGYVERVSQAKQKVVETVARTTGQNVLPFRKPTTAVDNDAARAVLAVFQVLPPGINAEVWLRGRTYYQSGLTGPNQRADAIFSIGHYLFYGDPDRLLPALGYGYEQERKWAIEQILQDQHHGYSEDINRGRGDAMTQVSRAAHWVPPHRRGQENVPYKPVQPIAWVRHNANLKVDTREKIKQAVAALLALGKRFSIRDLRDKAGCCEKTLYKHQDLWRDAYNRLLDDRFASVGHEYNAGVGVGSKENPLPAPVLQKDMPAGRLAARRIVYELRMREERAASEKLKTLERQAACLDERWKKQIVQSLPDGISDCDIGKLKALVTLYTWHLARSPDEESQQWLLSILKDIRCEIDVQSKADRLRCLDEIVAQETGNGSHPCNFDVNGAS